MKEGVFKGGGRLVFAVSIFCPRLMHDPRVILKGAIKEGIWNLNCVSTDGPNYLGFW